MGTGLLPIGAIDVLKFAQKQLADVEKVEFGDGSRGIRDQSSIRYPIRKIKGVNLYADYCCAQIAIKRGQR